jgi:hypothetical protein
VKVSFMGRTVSSFKFPGEHFGLQDMGIGNVNFNLSECLVDPVHFIDDMCRDAIIAENFPEDPSLVFLVRGIRDDPAFFHRGKELMVT